MFPNGCWQQNLHVNLPPHSHWDLDRGMSITIGIGTTAFGLNIIGSDGFTDNVHQSYISTSSAPTSYICTFGDPLNDRGSVPDAQLARKGSQQ